MEADVFVDDGMFIAVEIGNRPSVSGPAWGFGANLFFGIGSISHMKLAAEGARGARLLLLGYHVNLEEDPISLPGPEIIGAFSLINASVFTPGCLALDLHSLQELRGCINHWANTGRVWKWLAEPTNQTMQYADSNGIWIRCDAPGPMDIFLGSGAIRPRFVGPTGLMARAPRWCFSELIGMRKELTSPSTARDRVWFSGDATPTKIGGVNWNARGFFAEGPSEFVRTFLPNRRDAAHIDEAEFLTEVARSVLRMQNAPGFLAFGIPENACSDMWKSNGEALKGDGLQQTRTLRSRPLARKFRIYSFYCRSGRNQTAECYRVLPPAKSTIGQRNMERRGPIQMRHGSNFAPVSNRLGHYRSRANCHLPISVIFWNLNGDKEYSLCVRLLPIYHALRLDRPAPYTYC